jgi:hypothetical protein
MINLKLRLEVNDLWLPGNQNKVIANIYPEDRTAYSRDDRLGMKNVLIPVGVPDNSTNDFHHVSLQPGRYLVEAVLPSKEIVSQEIELTPEQSEVTLRLEASSSGHEWLAWQTLSGNVAPGKEYHPSMSARKSRIVHTCTTKLVMVPAPLPRNEPAYQQPDSPTWLSQGFFFANEPCRVALQDEMLVSGQDWLPVQAFPPPSLVTPHIKPNDNDDLSDLYFFDRNQVNGLFGKNIVGEGNRFYLFMNGQDLPAQYCVVPIPWNQLDYGGEVRTQVLAQRVMTANDDLEGGDQGFRLSAVVEESSLSMLIAYLGVGSMPAAQTILKTSTNLLASKMLNPMAAAAGSYVLLGMPIEELQKEYWHDWVRNLKNFFTWLPDGAIQYGRLLLKRGKHPDNLREARDCFLEGFRRGLPYFSKGVEFLLDGLTRFANDARESGKEDAEVENALRVTRNLALRTNPRQPFTTILID